MIKRIFILVVLSYMSLALKAQQLPHYSLYMLNDVIVNPSRLVGENENKITLMIRDQWASFEGAPVTQSISYNHVTHNLYKGGISIMNDVTGPISIINANIFGAYGIPLNENNQIALGISASFMQYSIDNSQITLENDGVFDPVMGGAIEKVGGNGLTIGTTYLNSKFYVGLAAQNILASSLDIGVNKGNNQLEKHYYIHSGLNIDLNENYRIKPSVMINKIGALPIQLDMNVRADYNNLLWSGLSYRVNDAFVTLFGINFGPSSLAYSYDITTSSLATPSSGTHSLLLSYKFIKKERDRDKDGVLDKDDDCPKIPGLVSLKGCPDKDNDGIIDSKDDCPDEFGLKINNGCPDTDGDGIIDKKDSCVNLAGIKRYDGCPDTDGDGLPDRYDDCPYEFGSVMNNGCPKVFTQDTIFITKIVVDTVFINSEENKYLSKEFKNIQFDHNKHTLTVNSMEILARVYVYLNNRIQLRINIEGHTDDVDSDEFNMLLSEKRVKEVKGYLVDKGISSSRIEISWKGESVPIVENISSQSRAINRRVEVRIIR
jgi:type IX secretion system PorP/SprF family membrane protein